MGASQSTIRKISESLPVGFEELEPVQRLEALLDTSMKVMGITDNLVLVNGDLTVSEFLGPRLSNQKLIDVLSQDSESTS